MQTLPTLFVSHGAPTFALEPGLAGANLAALGRRVPRPQAVLVVSPHWMTREAQATLSLRPETIHDFGGFDPALYTLQYPAEGAHLAARRALELLQAAGLSATADADRGLDHGAWVPLMHLYPEADIPVFQVSLPQWLDADGAYGYGRALAPLAGEGVLIVGSGSLTHNLNEFRLGDPRVEAYAVEFAHWVRDAVLAGDHLRLRQALAIAPHARRAHPTAEHYLPLLVAAGAAAQAVPASVIEGGVVHGVLSMDSFLFGTDLAVMQGADANKELPH